MQSLGLHLGRGSAGCEVAVAEAASRPTATELRRIWTKRHGGRASPLLLVVLHDGEVSVCGPLGDAPPVYRDLEPDQAERICRSALEAPDRHAALRLVRDVLPEADSPVPGLKNSGLLSTHELEVGVPRRGDWSQATEQGRALLSEGGRDVLRGLGYELESLPGPASILTARGSHQAVAVFLEQDEAVELASQRFTGSSPVQYAVNKAAERRIPWVVVAKGRMLRLYSAEAGTGVASRGRTETYVQVRTDLLRDNQAGYLWLLFSPEALADDGTLEQILRSSKDYAAELRGRLRERIYDDVVPAFAEAIARERGLRNPTRQELAETYETTLLLLYRLLFVAYAEDRRLLPYETNKRYQARSLKKKARELARIVQEGADFDVTAMHWREVDALFEAVREGSTEWGVPQYDGTLFTADPELSPEGAILEEIGLSNRQFGPPLAKLLVDEGPEGPGPIDFRDLGVREFGTIYEGLLESELSVADRPLVLDADGEYVPAGEDEEALVEAGEVYLHDTSGKRKSTGTYYTKTFAVEHLLKHSLDPALDRHLDRLDDLGDTDASERFFDFRVGDIAMGSGHFLLAAVDHIEQRFSGYLADRPLGGVRAELDRLRKRAREALGDPDLAAEIEDGQLLRRQIARRCIYGVDLNPTAVHLARLSLWIHTFVPGLPLSFLDHGLVEGNSVLGIATLDEAREAANLVEEGQASLFDEPMRELLERGQEAVERLGRLSDLDASEIREARRVQREAEEREAPLEALFDILAAARIDDELRERLAEGTLLDWGDLESLAGSKHQQRAREVLEPLEPFHFPVRFPEVFGRERSGFDVIVGNPPWEKTQVEENEFWARHYPGYKALPQSEQEELKAKFKRQRPQLVEKLENERQQAEIMRQVLTSGAFPGMGRSHPDLYKAFCWRFWNLARPDEGWIGVVLPRSAFAAKGSEDFRRKIFEHDRVHDLTMLLNRGGWVFDDAEHRYTIGLLALERNVAPKERELALRGPYRSRERFEYGAEQPPVTFVAEAVEDWNDTAALPLLPAEGSAEVFAQLRKAPRLDLDDGEAWRARPLQELNATNDKHLFHLEDDPPDHFWPVYKGESFDLWTPDTGTYYGWADPERVIERLQEKREWGANRSNSPWYEFPDEWADDASTHPCHQARIAFRDVTRSTDTRTTRVALVPPRVVLVHKAPTLVWPRGDEMDEAFLLGVMSSIPYDWYIRRFVEVGLYFNILNPSPVPRPDRSDPHWKRVVAISGRLATPDERFADWAEAVGAEVGAVPQDEQDDLVAELDAVVAYLYGLSAGQLRHVFETFHEGWDPTDRVERTLAHYEEWEGRA